MNQSALDIQPAPASATELVSVVVPVYEEAGNIAACLHGLASALASLSHEVLIVYDREEDSTLPAIAAMEDRPIEVRLVRNTLGKGVVNALKAGISAARGDVVVTFMADLSDSPTAILEMARKIRGEATHVVSGSRYMPGGGQVGGPRFKQALSRLAGWSLYWLAGLGTRDVTTNFRAYSRTFLDQVEIESQGGFEVALELTVKAHLLGMRIGEVPSVWRDRTAGESRFQLWKWLPHYWRWYRKALVARFLPRKTRRAAAIKTRVE